MYDSNHSSQNCWFDVFGFYRICGFLWLFYSSYQIRKVVGFWCMLFWSNEFREIENVWGRSLESNYDCMLVSRSWRKRFRSFSESLRLAHFSLWTNHMCSISSYFLYMINTHDLCRRTHTSVWVHITEIHLFIQGIIKCVWHTIGWYGFITLEKNRDYFKEGTRAF